VSERPHFAARGGIMRFDAYRDFGRRIKLFQ